MRALGWGEGRGRGISVQINFTDTGIRAGCDIDFISSGMELFCYVHAHSMFSVYVCHLAAELTSANTEYSTKLAGKTATEKTLRKLAWNADDLTHLNDDGRKLLVDSRQLQELAEGSETQFFSVNAPRQFSQLRKRVLSFLQGVYRFHRVAATHVFVIMISPEQRDRKPYALPVQCIPYASLKHSTCRDLVNNVISQMKRRGMEAAGVHFSILL